MQLLIAKNKLQIKQITKEQRYQIEAYLKAEIQKIL